MNIARICAPLWTAVSILLVAFATPPTAAQPLLTRSHDTLVICPSAFQPALQTWIDYRTRQGHSIKVVSPANTAVAIKQQIRSASLDGNLKFVFLVGDSDQEAVLHFRCVPTDYVAAKVNILFGSEPEIATDNTFADLDDDGLPDLAIGRLPADSAEEVERFLDRVIEYESSEHHQQWRRKVNFIAGVGGFGGLIDSVIQETAKQFIGELVPAEYLTTMTFGSWRSPYCPDPRRFSETAIGRFNEGCLFWVYMGHGEAQALDRIYLPDHSYPILDCRSVEQIHCDHGSPIAIFLSCYTGAADHPKDCLAELMMHQPRGPIAAICGTRVTMPYGMSLLSLEMVKEYFGGEIQTLGELTQIAKRRTADDDRPKGHFRELVQSMGQTLSPRPELLKSEQLEHIQLIHLFGDPLLRLKRAEPIQISNIEQDVKPGSTLTVTGVASKPGMLTVELAYQRGRFRERPARRSNYEASHFAFCGYQRTYEKSHDLTCAVRHLWVEQGPFEVELLVPTETKGKCTLKCMLESERGFGLGAVPVSVVK